MRGYRPRCYTTHQCGDWKEWKWGELSEEFFQNIGEPLVLLPEVGFIHALGFETPAAGNGRFARWDSMNGWTCTLEQALKAWPKGLHHRHIWEME